MVDVAEIYMIYFFVFFLIFTQFMMVYIYRASIEDKQQTIFDPILLSFSEASTRWDLNEITHSRIYWLSRSNGLAMQ
jgi:hypothetical protein